MTLELCPIRYCCLLITSVQLIVNEEYFVDWLLSIFEETQLRSSDNVATCINLRKNFHSSSSIVVQAQNHTSTTAHINDTIFNRKNVIILSIRSPKCRFLQNIITSKLISIDNGISDLYTLQTYANMCLA